jgi:hypothetical protein
MAFELLKTPNEARRLVWVTMQELKIQLNKVLGCKLGDGDFEFFTLMVMNKHYPKKRK